MKELAVAGEAACGLLAQFLLCRLILRTVKATKPRPSTVMLRAALILAAVFGVPLTEWLVTRWASSALQGGAILITALGGIVALGLGDAWQLAAGRPSFVTRATNTRNSTEDWKRLTMRERLEVRHYARRQRRHPDTVVAAIAERWAVQRSAASSHKPPRLARRILSTSESALVNSTHDQRDDSA